MIKLPEPSGFDVHMRRSTYTADQLKQAILDALEEAAKVCDNLTSEWTPEDCAEKIRKLKEDIQ